MGGWGWTSGFELKKLACYDQRPHGHEAVFIMPWCVKREGCAVVGEDRGSSLCVCVRAIGGLWWLRLGGSTGEGWGGLWTDGRDEGLKRERVGTRPDLGLFEPAAWLVGCDLQADCCVRCVRAAARQQTADRQFRAAGRQRHGQLASNSPPLANNSAYTVQTDGRVRRTENRQDSTLVVHGEQRSRQPQFSSSAPNGGALRRRISAASRRRGAKPGTRER